MAEISKTADQALTVLLKVGESGPLTPAQLARDLRMNRTVVHRLLTTLHQRGFVTRQDDGYIPGAALVRIAAQVQPDLRALGRAAMSALAEAVTETVVMHVPDGSDAVVLEQVVSDRNVVRVEHEIGSRHPLTRGASGRAILAFLGDSQIARVTKGLEDREAIRKQLTGVRQLGYALSHDELQQGVHGLAVPVLDSSGDRPVAIGSMAIIVPAMRSSNLAQHIDALQSAADGLARTLHAA